MLSKSYIKMLLILIFTPVCSHAITFVDVSECTFPGSKHGIRVAIFSVEHQKYEDISYYFPPSTSSTRIDPTKEILFSDFSVKHDCSVRKHDNVRENCIFRSRGDLDGETLPKLSIPGDELCRKLEIFNADISVPEFNVTINGERAFFKSIILADKAANSNERKQLGELATEITMISYNYSRLPSQNKSDHNFDGVFINEDKKSLFLTESKCRSEKKSAEAYMDDELDEHDIYKRISTLEHEDTRNKIREYIREYPNNIYKIVQRLKPNGEIQCCVRQINFFYYNLRLMRELHPNSPETGKINTLIVLKEQMGVQSLPAMFDLLLKTFGVSREEAFCEILMGSLTPTQQERVNGKLYRSVSPIPFSLDTTEDIPVKVISTDTEEKSKLCLRTPSSHSYTQVNTSQAAFSPNESLLLSSSQKTPSLFDLLPAQDSTPRVKKKSFKSVAKSSEEIENQQLKETLFATYSYGKLQSLIRFVSTEGSKGYKGVGMDKIGRQCGYSSKKPIQRLLGKESGTPEDPESMWSKFTSTFSEFCSTNKLPESTILKLCNKDEVFST